MTKPPHRIHNEVDYVKFVIEMDWDLGQTECRRVLDFINKPTCDLTEKLNFKLTILGPTQYSAGRNRYCFEAWGPDSIQLVDAVGARHLEHLNRVDFRMPLLCTSNKSVKDYAAKLFASKNGSRNITTFDTKSRTKSASRDTGGTGVRIGSGKSASYTVIYQQGDESPAVECRFTLGKAQDIGTSVAQALDEGSEASLQELIFKAADRAARAEMYKATGCPEKVHLERDMVDAQVQANRIQQAIDWAATQDEEDYWTSLSLEQQEAMLGEGWTRTDAFKARHTSGK